MTLHSMRRRSQSGFSLLELMVVVATIAIISAIAVPNARSAMRKARHTAAYKNMKVLESGIQSYMFENNGPPTSVNSTTLEPLISGGHIPRQQRNAILNSIEGGRLYWYYGWTGGGAWWDYDYGICFRPRRDPGNVWCYLWPEGIWRWEDGYWTQVM